MKRLIATIALATSFLVLTSCSKSNTVDNNRTSLYQKGLELTNQMDNLAESEDYITLISASTEMTKIIKEIGDADYSKPIAVYEIDGIDTAYMELLTVQYKVTLSDEIEKIARDRIASAVAPQINAQKGAMFLAASSCINVSDSFIFHGLEQQKTYFFIYDNGYHSIVTFTPHDNNIVEAKANFVKNEILSEAKTTGDIESFFQSSMGITNLKVTEYRD